MRLRTKSELLSQAGMSPSGKRWATGLLIAVAMHGFGGVLLLTNEKEPVAEPEQVITVQLTDQSLPLADIAATTRLQTPETDAPTNSDQIPAEPNPSVDRTAPTLKTQSQPETLSQSETQPVIQPKPEKIEQVTKPVRSEPVIKPVTEQQSRAEQPQDFTPSDTQAKSVNPATSINQEKNPVDSPVTQEASNSSTPSTKATVSTGLSKPDQAKASNNSSTPKGAEGAPKAAQVSSRAAKKATQNYYAMISEHLNRHKSYSAAAKKQQLTGVVTVRFTVEPSGVISASSIKSSSGHALLDKETLKLLERVSPLPPMPADMNQEAVSISLPINYQLQTR